MNFYLKSLCRPRAGMAKILLVMRLIIVLLTTAILQVSASGYAQKITLSERNASLEQVLKKIKTQSGYNVVYASESLDGAKKVNLQFSELALELALEQIFKNQPLTYELKDKTIVIKEKAPSFLDNLVARFSAIDIRGKIIGENDQALAGATVKVKGTNRITKSNDKGEFYLAGVEDDAVLEISYIGFKALEIPVKGAVMPLEIKLNIATGELEEVKVVYNTGYQNIDKTRATGSFVQVDNELIDRKVGTDILSRLEGVVPGLLFDRRPDLSTGKPKQNLQIRGLYTLSEEISQPLIVVDNFPFAGDLLDINPNDVENITILKDAAAASIWGAKAGNGVIVITTKKGKFNQKFQASLNTNMTIATKPDLFSIKDLSSSDYIDLEKILFAKGQYDAKISDPIFGALTPVQEILLKMRNGEINQVEADRQIDLLRQYDVRNDFMKYIYRDELAQRYSLNLSGGSNTIKYNMSGGFDKDLSSLRGNEGTRFTFRSNTTISPVKQLQLRISLSYTQSAGKNNTLGEFGSGAYGVSGSRLYSYARLADDNGNALAIDKNYRKVYTDTEGSGKLLDWKFRPLDELQHKDDFNSSRNLVGGLQLNYSIIKGLGVELSYQYQKSDNDQRNYNSIETYFTRDLINRFTQINGSNVKYIVPKDGILTQTNGKINTQNLRTALNFNRSWNSKHEISMLAGGEISDGKSGSSQFMVYGYNERLNASNVDFVNQYPVITGGTGTIPSVPSSSVFTEFRDRSVSIYSNASYTYNQKYTVTGSARRDASNLFGVKTNDKGRPFWSIGGLWNIAGENFYKINAVPQLKARITYGYSGNVKSDGTAITVINYLPTNNINNLPSANILTPGNPSLRWENLRTFNAAVDFGLKNQILSGSIEYYNKKSTDVIALELLDNSTGITNMSSNSADMSGNGIELRLNAQIINNDLIRYNASFNLAHEKYEVTKYMGNLDLIGNTSSGQLILPYSNPYSIISLKWAGLDPLTGDPQGILNGEVSKDYNNLLSPTASPITNSVNNGSALPKVYGNFLNSISIKGFSLSANITYKLGYSFIRPSIDYPSLLEGIGHVDYNNRWKKPGDELLTSIPSIDYSISSRSTFYRSSEILVEPADHIRLNDVQFSYNLPKSLLQKLKLGALQLYGYVNNLNILLYKENKAGLDPERPDNRIPKQSKSISIGLRADL